MAVTAFIKASSSTQATAPDDESIASVKARALGDTVSAAHRTIMPSPMAAGVLGMQRMMGVASGSAEAIWAMVMPAATDTKVAPARASAVHWPSTGTIFCG